MNRPDRPLEDDERLISRLAALARQADPPPPDLYELGRATFQLYRIDDELAELVADSWLDSHAVRAGTSEVRLLSFEGPGASLEIQLTGGGATRSVLGQLVGPPGSGPGRAFLHQPDGSPAQASAVDEYGRFEFPEAPAGLFRIRVEPAGSPAISTGWLRP
jgi:hypothetical protein